MFDERCCEIYELKKIDTINLSQKFRKETEGISFQNDI